METKQDRIFRSLKTQIEKGSLTVGDKLPSIRLFARENGVGIQTTLGAYAKLEDSGYIESRERSGYYVAIRTASGCARKCKNAKPILIERGADDAIVDELFRYIGDPSYTNFGALIPHCSFLLDRELTSTFKGQARWHRDYGEPHGNEALRSLILGRLIGKGAIPRSVELTCGAMGALAIALRLATQGGDVVAVESPFYFGYKNLFSAAKVKPYEIPADPQIGLQVESVAAAYEKQPFKALLLNSSFSNPTGALMSESTKRELCELAVKKGFFILEDDVYGEIFFGTHRPPRLIDFDQSGVVFYCGSVTKILSPGIKVGWLVIPSSLAIEARHLKHGLSGFSSQIYERISLRLLKSKKMQLHLRRVRRKYERNVESFRNILRTESKNTLLASSPSGGYHLWLEGPPSLDSHALLQRLLPHKILISPGDLFSYTHRYRNYFRINCALKATDQLTEKLSIISSEALKLAKSSI